MHQLEWDFPRWCFRGGASGDHAVLVSVADRVVAVDHVGRNHRVVAGCRNDSPGDLVGLRASGDHDLPGAHSDEGGAAKLQDAVSGPQPLEPPRCAPHQ